MFNRIRRFMEQAREAEAVAALSERDLADLGVSREQARNLAGMSEDVPGRALAMGRVFGHDERDLTHDRVIWRELLETCQSCRALPYCTRFLAQGHDDAAARHEAAGFCPNRASFEQLAQPA